MVGYYDDSRITAQKCPPLCIDCLSPYDCFQCIQGYEFIVQKSSCEPIPPSGLSTMVKLLIGIGAGAAVIGGAVLLVRWHNWHKLKIQKAKEKMIANSRYLNVFQRC